MTKKVTDIISPKKKEDYSKARILVKSKKQKKKVRIKFTFPIAGKKSLIFGALVLILVPVVCYFTLSKAKIEVWPVTNDIDLTTKLTVDITAESPDFISKVIPGEIFKKEKTVNQVFPATGVILKEEKAEGIVRVYNEYSTSPQVLVATTRFVSSDGKLFRTFVRVTVPGGQNEEGKFVPGEIDIEVVADQPGPDYNIGPTTFSIPGFAGTDRYTKFYAKSFQAMKGGFREEVSQITREDLEQAEEAVAEKAEQESEKALKEELKSEEYFQEFEFVEEAIQVETVDTFSLATAGEEAEDFNFQVKTEAKTIIFKKEDINNFVEEFISTQIAEDKEIYRESLKIEYTPETINFESGKMILSLVISGKIYSDVDFLVFKDGLKGKSLSEAELFLGSQPSITKVNIEFWPFWVKSVPENLDKIEFKLNLD